MQRVSRQRLPPTVAMLRWPGPAIASAASRRGAIAFADAGVAGKMRASVTPAPMRAPASVISNCVEFVEPGEIDQQVGRAECRGAD